MKRVVKYISTDRYYSDQEQTYIGSTPDEVDRIQQEVEEYMAREHCSLSMIYTPETIYDDTTKY